MRSKDAIKRWMASLGEPSSDYEPNESVSQSLPGIRLPGGSCYDCTKKRVGMLDVMRPLYQNIFDRFGQLGGRSNGIVIGLFIDASEPMIYFNIPVLAKKPIQILPPRVYPS